MSLVSTVSVNGVHMHMSFADSEGIVRSGPLKGGIIIHPPAEVVRGYEEAVEFRRELDTETGFAELVVKPEYPLAA